MNRYGVEVKYSNEDECYLARCPELRPLVNNGGWVARGDTWEEAAREIGVAIGGLVEVLKESGVPLPLPETA